MTRPGYQTARNNQPATSLPGRHHPERRSVYAITPLQHGEISMRLQYHLIALALILSPVPATADPVMWQRFAIPETNAAVDIPTTVFTEDAGKPPTGYGRRFLTSDARADLTVQSVPNDAGDSPAAFLAKMNPPSNIVYKRVTSRFFVVSSFRNGKIWYNRCNFAQRFMNCVLINYPAAEKRQWDSVITRISNTLASR